MRCGAHAVFVTVGVRSRRAGHFRFATTPLAFRRAIVATALSSPVLRFEATTFLMPGRRGRFYQRGNGCLHVVESRFQLIFKRRKRSVYTTEDKLVALTPCKLFDVCLRALYLTDANE